MTEQLKPEDRIKRVTWDISLVDADGKEVDTSSFDTVVSVKVPIPSDWYHAVAYHINDDGTKTLMPSLVVGDNENGRFLVYTTTHFSKFAAGETAADVPGEEAAPKLDADDEDAGNISKPNTNNNSSKPNTESSNSTVTPGDTDKNSGGNSDNNSGNDQANTGIALAAAPIVLACAAVIAVSKKKK